MKPNLHFKILPNEMVGKYEVVLYSHEQKCYHIESFVDYLRENVEDFITSDEWNGYQIVGIFDTYEKASEYVKTLREIKTGKNENTIE